MLIFDKAALPAVRSRVILDRKTAPGADTYEVLQTYTLADAQPHENRDGTSSAVLTWQSRCADCDAMFRFKTGLTPNFYRRCPKCRQAMTAAGRHAGGWARGTKNRFTLHPPKSAAAVEIDPASLF